MLVTIVLLAGCADESSDNRRFANDPAPTDDPLTASATPAATLVSAEPTVALPSPESLLATRGAPGHFYVAVEDELWAIGDGQSRQLELPSGLSMLGFDGSPNGDRVAVAVRDGGGGVSLLIFGSDGAIIRTVADVVALDQRDEATPAAVAVGQSSVSVDWGLQGDTILLGEASGRLTMIPIEDEPSSFTVAIDGGALLEARLSPRGDSVATLQQDAEGVVRVLVAPITTSGQAEPRVVAPEREQAEKTVLDMAWLPDGGSLLYLQSDADESQVAGSELFQVRLEGQERELIALGGRAGPAGGILDFQQSPDGKSVAYVLGIPEGESWIVHSVWLASLRDPIDYQVPTGSATDVAGLWWVQDGLVWATRVSGTGGAEEIVFYQVGSDAAPMEILALTVGPDRATPAAGTPTADSPSIPTN